MSATVDLRAVRAISAKADEAERRVRLAEQREVAVHALNDRLKATIQSMGHDFMEYIKATWPLLPHGLAVIAAELWKQGTGGKPLPGPMPANPNESTPVASPAKIDVDAPGVRAETEKAGP